jgi:secreted Zn-dependent insulinase-like peptidase
MPLQDRLDEMLVIDAVSNQNSLNIVYDFAPNTDRSWLQTTKIVDALLYHKGKGGLYSTLKEKGLIESINIGDDTSSRTAVH